MKKNLHILSGLGLALALVSCATVNQKLSLAPLSTDFPVSASQTLYAENTVIGSEDFENSQAFSTVKTVRVPLLTGEASLDVSEDLNAQVEGGDFNGVTKFKLSVVNVDSTDVYWVGLERYLGALSGIVGLAMVSVSASLPEDNGGGNYIPAIIAVGSGATLFGLSYLHENSASVVYTFDLSGLKVKY